MKSNVRRSFEVSKIYHRLHAGGHLRGDLSKAYASVSYAQRAFLLSNTGNDEPSRMVTL